jgi:hypothetical protein
LKRCRKGLSWTLRDGSPVTSRVSAEHVQLSLRASKRPDLDPRPLLQLLQTKYPIIVSTADFTFWCERCLRCHLYLGPLEGRETGAKTVSGSVRVNAVLRSLACSCSTPELYLVAVATGGTV